MKLYKFDRDKLSFKQVSYVKYLMAWTALTLSIMIAGISKQPRTITEIEPIERWIVLNEENKFTEEKFIEEIKRLNFNFPHIVYSQSFVETGRWTSRIYKENHNLFGMKEAMVRAHLAVGTQHKHAYYHTWKESLYDYALYYSEYLSDIKTEEQYLEYINQRYAEHPEYDSLVAAQLPRAKKLFGIK